MLYNIAVEVPEGLNLQEINRVMAKMYIVEEIAQRATDAMAKGTVKYDSDQHTYYEWMEHLMQDAMDACIYPYFLRDNRWHSGTIGEKGPLGPGPCPAGPAEPSGTDGAPIDATERGITSPRGVQGVAGESRFADPYVHLRGVVPNPDAEHASHKYDTACGLPGRTAMMTLARFEATCPDCKDM